MNKDFPDDLYRSVNYEICTSLDMIKLGIVLDKMAVKKIIPEQVAKTYYMQAHALLNAIRNDNSRYFKKDLTTP